MSVKLLISSALLRTELCDGSRAEQVWTCTQQNLIMLKVWKALMFVLAGIQSSLSSNDSMKMNPVPITALVFTENRGLLPGYCCEHSALHRNTEPNLALLSLQEHNTKVTLHSFQWKNQLVGTLIWKVNPCIHQNHISWGHLLIQTDGSSCQWS